MRSRAGFIYVDVMIGTTMTLLLTLAVVVSLQTGRTVAQGIQTTTGIEDLSRRVLETVERKAREGQLYELDNETALDAEVHVSFQLPPVGDAFNGTQKVWDAKIYEYIWWPQAANSLLEIVWSSPGVLQSYRFLTLGNVSNFSVELYDANHVRIDTTIPNAGGGAGDKRRGGGGVNFSPVRYLKLKWTASPNKLAGDTVQWANLQKPVEEWIAFRNSQE